MEFLGLIILAVLIFLYMMKKTGKNLNQISAQELKSILGDGDKQFIDVRTPGEYKHNHIRQFKNMPLQTLQQHADTLFTEREIIVICQSGMRSANACKLFKQKGFTNVTNVKGGMNSWLNEWGS